MPGPYGGLSHQLLLQHLIAKPDGTRKCTLDGCPLNRSTFNANSDSAAWKNHFSAYHKAVLESLQAQCDGKVCACGHGGG
jgi:hypothetical protein